MLIGGTKNDFRYGIEIGTTSCQREGKCFKSSPYTSRGPSLRDRNELPSPTTANPVGTQSSCAYYDRTEDRVTVTSTMNTAYRTHKNRMFQHYSVFNSKEEALEHPYPDMNKEEWTRVCDLFASEEFQRRSAINKENRAKLKIVHTSEVFPTRRALKIQNLMRLVLCHIKRTLEDARENFEKMEALQLQHESEGKSYTEVEIFAVLGTKAGYVRGLGRSVRSVGSSSSTVSVDLSRRLEEARLEIEEMRARQMEYEALLVKRSDMEQTMQEHLQMIEEQQRKKDEELMQRWRSSNGKKKKSIRNDAGTTKEPSGTTRMEDATNGGADA
ncbi:hypothetical protein CJ030_MR8G010108 [Morella rubra]|uniref:Uncharacterized protein n=1 Tax=Morella rubra TaxID=262757 RepID=A0A6A1UP46_9ROSI|nr:hypothetical protein CJ030_MR8G010108 [Morella rubra]